ncbi:hypothetical protein [Longimicrobium sp.]|uniref:hypothetical protein n=1 Tax=Longimicrobium sp. TaxID=2029185 RepID=UPI002C552B12|nr:hypothetical protein [Longimicrobium sp.]HSU17022.1 hypothetical protein [Longimicrobium sp.]
MTTHGARLRLQELRGAFDTLTRTHDGLSVLPAPLQPDGDARQSIDLRLIGAGSPEVLLRVWTNSADLTARSGADHLSAGRGEISDSLGVALDSGFAWDASVCDSADELARLLLKHMRRRLKAVGELLPDG